MAKPEEWIARLQDLYQLSYNFFVRFNKIDFSCHEVSEIRIMSDAEGRPILTPFTIKAAMLTGKKSLAQVVQEAGVKDVVVEVVHLTQGARQRIARIVTFEGCNLMYTMDRHKADENNLLWESVLVTPKSLNVSHVHSGRLFSEWQTALEGLETKEENKKVTDIEEKSNE